MLKKNLIVCLRRLILSIQSFQPVVEENNFDDGHYIIEFKVCSGLPFFQMLVLFHSDVFEEKKTLYIGIYIYIYIYLKENNKLK